MKIHSKSDVRPVPDLLRDLRDETVALLQQEMALARAEMAERTGRLAGYAVRAAFGGMLVLAGTLFLLWAVTAGVEIALIAAGPEWGARALWLAPLIVGGTALLLGLTVAYSAVRGLRRTSFVPEKTVATLKEDREWLAKKAA